MESHIIAYSIAIIILIMFSAYFSATETAFTSVNRIRIKNLAANGDKRAERVLELSDRYDSLLSTILIGNNLVNILITVIATLMFVELYGSLGPTIATVVTTVLILVFGEITPKSLAKEIPEKISKGFGGSIRIVMIVFTPVNYLFSAWKKFVAKAFKMDAEQGITEEELLTMVEEAETEGGLDEERSELIQNAIEFNGLEAWDILTPRVDVAAIEVDTCKDDILKIFRDSGFSRIPVYDDDIDNILGVLNQKDFHNYIYGTSADIREYVAPVVFIPETMKIPVILKKMQTTKTHMAVVIDEYGGLAGIVTLEDILEELVGEIYDEHDTVISQEIIPLYDGSYRVKGSANVEKLFDFFDVDDYIDPVTVNGWVALELDKLPETGDCFEYRSEKKLFRVRVTKADERKALEVNLKVELLDKTESGYTKKGK